MKTKGVIDFLEPEYPLNTSMFYENLSVVFVIWCFCFRNKEEQWPKCPMDMPMTSPICQICYLWSRYRGTQTFFYAKSQTISWWNLKSDFQWRNSNQYSAIFTYNFIWWFQSLLIHRCLLFLLTTGQKMFSWPRIRGNIIVSRKKQK